jgi:hypothetical protein
MADRQVCGPTGRRYKDQAVCAMFERWSEMARNSGAFFISIHCVTDRSISFQGSGWGESFATFRDFEEL